MNIWPARRYSFVFLAWVCLCCVCDVFKTTIRFQKIMRKQNLPENSKEISHEMLFFCFLYVCVILCFVVWCSNVYCVVVICVVLCCFVVFCGVLMCCVVLCFNVLCCVSLCWRYLHKATQHLQKIKRKTKYSWKLPRRAVMILCCNVEHFLPHRFLHIF